jgi:hypothetical protein
MSTVLPATARYYLDEAFELKMAEVLCVYREVAILRETEAIQPDVAIISYGEKPGIQAIGNSAPDWPPQQRPYAGWARDHEYKRHGTLLPLAGIDLLMGQVHACVENRHRPGGVCRLCQEARRRIPDRHGHQADPRQPIRHISKKTRAWLADQPRAAIPKQGSGFASHPRENSRQGSSPTSMISTENPSSVPGL